jgi:hypothetical protein
MRADVLLSLILAAVLSISANAAQLSFLERAIGGVASNSPNNPLPSRPASQADYQGDDLAESLARAGSEALFSRSVQEATGRSGTTAQSPMVMGGTIFSGERIIASQMPEAGRNETFRVFMERAHLPCH